LDDEKMTIVLHSKPATPEDVAEILGVPKRRVKWLKRLMESQVTGGAKDRKLEYRRTPGVANSGKRRKNVRGKAKKNQH
jgi:hypothetical protein